MLCRIRGWVEAHGDGRGRGHAVPPRGAPVAQRRPRGVGRRGERLRGGVSIRGGRVRHEECRVPLPRLSGRPVRSVLRTDTLPSDHDPNEVTIYSDLTYISLC